jgi:PIN domain nuclease of toxin-antitoxin system
VIGVLDSWAVLAWLRDEPAGSRVLRLLEAEEQVMSSVNLGEVLYWTIRDRGEDRATAVVETVRGTLSVDTPDWRTVTVAARFKAQGGLSYADAFCVATALRHGLPVFTGDPEILGLEDPGVEIVDLRTAP